MDADSKTQWENCFEDATVEEVRSFLAREPALVSVPVRCTLKNGSVRTWSPLFVASNKLRCLGKVKALVEAGADLANNESGTHWPSEDFAINAYLIEKGVDVNQPSYLGFHAAGVTGLDSFFLMMENGLDVNFAWPHNGETLLHVQSRCDDDAHLAGAYCLIKAGANVNAQTQSGLDDEPIMDNEHFVRYGRETPLHFAARLGNPKQTLLLLSHGANTSLKSVSRMTDPKELGEWPGEVSSLLWPKTEFKRIAFEAYGGETPLEMALREGHEEVVQILRSGQQNGR